jgi:hypothetical protein
VSTGNAPAPAHEGTERHAPAVRAEPKTARRSGATFTRAPPRPSTLELGHRVPRSREDARGARRLKACNQSELRRSSLGNYANVDAAIRPIADKAEAREAEQHHCPS